MRGLGREKLGEALKREEEGEGGGGGGGDDDGCEEGEKKSEGARW